MSLLDETGMTISYHKILGMVIASNPDDAIADELKTIKSTDVVGILAELQELSQDAQIRFNIGVVIESIALGNEAIEE